MRSARVEGAASLTWGLPSFRTPAYIRQAVERELEADPDIGKYALPDGLPELRRLVAAERSAIGPEVDAERERVLLLEEREREYEGRAGDGAPARPAPDLAGRSAALDPYQEPEGREARDRGDQEDRS